MMKRIYIYLFGAVLLAFVSSCSSTKNMKKSVSIGNLSETEYMTEVLNRAPAWDASVSYTHLTLPTKLEV